MSMSPEQFQAQSLEQIDAILSRGPVFGPTQKQRALLNGIRSALIADIEISRRICAYMSPYDMVQFTMVEPVQSETATSDPKESTVDTKKLFGCLSKPQAEAAKKMYKAGIPLLAILDFLRQHGDEIMSIVGSIIALFNQNPGPAFKEGKGESKVKEGCEALAEHLCATQCALIEGLYQNHAACHEVNCHPEE